ncbi:MAG: DNA internalization-related competence protein ComEC/Rec2 [Ignavibacteriales bacterium]|nr:DNA internalization-related competence protein ComEC/Rec2 [Ignavibacteriales bacterium]
MVDLPPLAYLSVTVSILAATLVAQRLAPHTWAIVLWHLLMISAAATLHTYHEVRSKEQILNPLESDEAIALAGTVASETERHGKRNSFIVETDSIQRHGVWRPGTWRVLVSSSASLDSATRAKLEIGRRATLRAELRQFPRPRNPGEFDYGKFLTLNNVQGTATLAGWSEVEIDTTPLPISLAGAVAATQQMLYRTLEDLHPQEAASFLKGIVLGYRADLSADVKQSFIDTGTIHILAVSGSNVAVVALIFIATLGFFRLSKRLTTVLAIGGLVVYMLITGSSPSVERATIMAIVIIAGALFERTSDIYNSLSVAALALLVFNTNTLFDVGFQLSFAAVLSIVYFYPKLERLITLIPERFEEIKAVDLGLKLFAVSLAAQLGTLPFTAYYFGRVSAVSLLANLIVVPLAGLNTFIGFAELLFYPFSMWLAHTFAFVNDVLIDFLLRFVQIAASVPHAVVEVANPSLSSTAMYYVAVVGLFGLFKERTAKWVVLSFLLAANLLVYVPLCSASGTALRLTTIDVGQGDGLLVEFPNGRAVLLDAGPLSTGFDAGQRFVVPLLKKKGIDRLEALIVSHPHSDHIGGMKHVLAHVKVGRFLYSESQGESALSHETIALAESLGCKLEQVAYGTTVVVDSMCRLYVLHPRLPEDSTRNLNNASLVIRLQYGNTSALLVGDSEAEVEEKLDRRYKPMLSADILKAGHHGSKTSSSEEFIDAVRPKMVLISVGEKNKFKHPSPIVLERFKVRGVDIHRTDREGAIVVESDGVGWKIIDWRH